MLEVPIGVATPRGIARHSRHKADDDFLAVGERL